MRGGFKWDPGEGGRGGGDRVPLNRKILELAFFSGKLTISSESDTTISEHGATEAVSGRLLRAQDLSTLPCLR